MYPYGNNVEDGGTMLWMNYYDVMGRLRWLDADNAYTKLTKMLYRCGHDPYYLSFGPSATRRMFDSYDEFNCEIGTNTDFPESGISGLSMLHGFMGIQPKENGLNITPKLPGRMLYAQCADIYYKGISRTVRVSRGVVSGEVADWDTDDRLSAGTDSMSQDFVATGAFDELGFLIGNNRLTDISFDATLYSCRNGRYTRIATRRLYPTEDFAWVYFAFPAQSAGERYRITLSNVSKPGIMWLLSAKSKYLGCDAMRNGYIRSGNFTLRVIDVPLSTTLTQTTSDTCDRCLRGSNLQQDFAASLPFSRLAVQVSAKTSGCTLALERNMGGDHWRTVSAQQFDSVVDKSWLTMSFADQPAGTYRLTMRNPTGTIGWFRSSLHASPKMLIARTNGVTVPGDRTLTLQRGIYNITIAPDGVNTNVDAGDIYLFNP
jgi:hypothetical protein